MSYCKIPAFERLEAAKGITWKDAFFLWFRENDRNYLNDFYKKKRPAPCDYLTDGDNIREISLLFAVWDKYRDFWLELFWRLDLEDPYELIGILFQDLTPELIFILFDFVNDNWCCPLIEFDNFAADLDWKEKIKWSLQEILNTVSWRQLSKEKRKQVMRMRPCFCSDEFEGKFHDLKDLFADLVFSIKEPFSEKWNKKKNKKCKTN